MITHDTDFYAWTQDQAAALGSRDWVALDVVTLADEVVEMGKAERRAVESFLIVILEHMAKLEFVAGLDCRNKWLASVIAARNGLRRRIKESPSLRNYPSEILQEVWNDVHDEVGAEFGIILPDACPWTIEDVVEGFKPARGSAR